VERVPSAGWQDEDTTAGILRVPQRRPTGHEGDLDPHPHAGHVVSHEPERNCPVSIDLHPADNLVEIALGEYRIGGDMLRLVVDHPDTCRRLTEALHEAGARLTAHLHAKASPDPALSQVDWSIAR
jgi:hypothetical protein